MTPEGRAAAATGQGARRLYYDSPALEFTATVTDIRLVATKRGAGGANTQLWQVALDRTAFYPESGGQLADTGVLVATARSGATLEVRVERVEEDGAGEVWHFIRKPLVEGTEVVGRVDAERRRDHTQQHSGQHLLSAVFWERLGARTVSFHMGAEVSTIDLALPEGRPEFTPEELRAVEDEVHRLLFQNRPLTPRWHTREEAEAMLARGDLRKLPERSGPLRIVEMGGVEFNACGGTHVAATGAIGGLSLRRLEKVKAGWRVEFVCGGRAARTARRDYELLSEVAASLSVGVGQVAERVGSLLASVKSGTKERQTLLGELAAAEVISLDARFAPGALIEAAYAGRDMSFARRLATGLSAKGRGAVLGVASDEESGVFLLRPPDASFHAGELMKSFLNDVLPQGEGRGGGSAESAQILLKQGSVGLISERLVVLVEGLRGPTAPQK